MIDIAWGQQYSVGNEMIDHQHQVFVDLIRSSSDAIDRRRSEESVRRSLDELVLFAKFHFFAEESMMINSGYPDSESHVKEHARVLSAFEKMIDEYFSNSETGEALVVFMFEWLVLHRVDFDQKLAAHLDSHRLLGDF